jgi:hypothetical protein
MSKYEKAAEKYFNEQAEFNKWLLELTESERSHTLSMLEEFAEAAALLRQQGEERPDWMKHFALPFIHAEDSTFVLDGNGNPVIEVRGWGHLSHKMTDEEAGNVQEQMAKTIADMLNALTPSSK